MWKGPDGDPGGGSGDPPSDQSSSETVSDLKEQYDQSEILLAQLKEVLKKSEQTTVTPEKVELYASTLSRAKRNKLRKEHDGSKSTTPHKTVDTPATEKINLLRQQLEENKAKLAERGKSQKGIEQMVIQLRAQLDDSQQLINQTPLNLSLVETKVEYSKNSSSEELYNILLSKERYITDLGAKVQKLEANVLDLQENVKEKDAVIDARTKAITLMTESLTKKGKSTLDALDDTKEQMRKMQENFVQMEADMKARQLKLLDDLKQKNVEIAQAEEMISSLRKENEQLNNELTNKSDVIRNLETKVKQSGSPDSADEAIQNYIQQIDELKAQLKQFEESSLEPTPSQELSRSSPQRSSKKGKRRFRSPAVYDAAAQEAKISDLQKALEIETTKNEKLQQTISSLEVTINDLNNTITELEEKMNREVSVSSEQEHEEVSKLKKQLDEQNKNMIKVKAQHKSKIKELTKKIDVFKKVSDANAELVKLEAENSKLSQKIAELEEEKGNLQLKLVETDSKDSPSPEQFEELNRQLSEKLNEIQLKDETISHLESEIQSSKAEIASLNEKLNSLSHLQQVQVTTEMTSIQYEEQLDRVESEKKLLLEEKQNMLVQNQDLLEKLEALRKEKQELMTKFETLEQENMELMEKLEKLSTEKVSSAESIEIVEGLTQQEKLEIEQFQKNLDIVSGNLKVSEENLMPTPDLNESVNQLTEETSELLQKIELFTVERREVMEKMELLTSDNNNLSLKIKEIENNRDVLAETYEQLQNEKECLDNKIEELEKENDDLKKRLNSSESLSDSANRGIKSDDISEDLSDLQTKYTELLVENERLQIELKRNAELVHEKETIEKELRQARQTISEMELKIRENIEEINNYQTLIEDNKNELVSSADLITKLKNKLETTEDELQAHKNEVAHLTSVIADLNNAVMNLESENKNNIESNCSVENQLTDLKSVLNEHIQQAEEYEKELDHNSETINNLNKELKTLNNRIIETEHLLNSKDDEIRKLLKERDNKETVINSLQESIKEKDEAFHKLRNDLKEKYLNMQKQMDANSGTLEDIKVPLQKTIDELTQKNKEQLDKMKRIAANLKKKNQAHQELEQKFSAQKEDLAKMNQEREDLQKHIIELSNNLEKIRDASKKHVEENARLAEELQQMNVEKAELSAIISELTQTEDQMTGSLHQEMSFESSNLTSSSESADHLKSKIQELKLVRQNQNSRILEYEERIAQLEENAVSDDHVRMTLEKQLNELSVQLEERNNKIIEVSEAENVLLDKLTELTAKCENFERQLAELHQENAGLREQIKLLNEHNEKLKQKVNVAQERVHELSNCGEDIIEKEQEIENLCKTVAHLETEVKHLHSELERSANERKKDLETIDSDWQLQSNEWLKEKNELTIQVEKLNEQVSEINEKNNSLQNEMSEYKDKLTEHENNVKLLKNDNQQSYAKIEELNGELLASQQENENLRLSLNDVSSQMVTYQQQCRQLQGENASLINQLMNVSSSQNNEMAVLYNELNKQLEETTSEKQQLIVHLQRTNDELNRSQMELQSVRGTLKSAEDEIKLLRSNIQMLKDDVLKETVVSTVDSILTQATQTVSMINTAHKTTQAGQEKLPSVEEPFAFPGFSLPQAKEIPQEKQLVEPIMTTKSLFGSPDRSDPFSFAVLQPRAVSFDVELAPQQTERNYSLEDLLEKVKALEIMLITTEKEKNDALQHCDELSNELVHLVYERQNTLQQSAGEAGGTASDAPDSTVPSANIPISQDLLSQIQSDLDIQQTQSSKELRQLEFQPSKPCVGTCDSEVVEEKLQADAAYLCYKKDAQPIAVGPFAEDDGQDLLSQIQSDLDIQQAQSSKELHQLEFQPSKPCVGTCDREVVEEKLQAAAAYLCYKKDAQPIAVDPFAEDDGWGFSPEEVRLEAQHVRTAEATNQSAAIEELQEKIRVLELERQNHMDEIKQHQIKSGKLVKKLKELKLQNEKLISQAKKSEGDFFSLDDAIQEELKSQVEQLEKKLKELSTELNKEKKEKSSIMQRIDVLTAAHERMVEMKDKQDIEVLSWQRRHRELSEKLERFEWADDGFGVPEHRKEVKPESCEKPSGSDVHEMQKKIEELSKTIEELTLDREELQALLDEQTHLRIEAEKAQKSIPQFDYSDLMSEKDELSKKYMLSLEERKQLQETYNNLLKESDAQRHMLQQIEENNNTLNELNSVKEAMVEELTNKLQSLEYEKSQIEFQSVQNINNELQMELQQQLSDVMVEKENLDRHLNTVQEELRYMQKEKDAITDELLNKNTYIDNLLTQLENLKKENISLHSVSQDRNTEPNYQDRYEKISQERDSLLKQIQEKDQEITDLSDSLNTQMATLKEELDKQIKTVESLLEENKNLTENLSARNFEYDQVSQQLQAKDVDISSMIEQLTREWESRVDQRGTDVAESWKLHVDARESEFSRVQEVMRKEINELEEKCNALVNENNELRKNVDAEIKNEVDRIAALQKQIIDRQHTINDLSQSLQQKQQEIVRLQNTITTYETQIVQLNDVLKEKDDFIKKQASDEEAIQAEFNENQEIIRMVLLKLQEKSPFISNDRNDIVLELDKLIIHCNENEKEIEELREKLSKLVSSDELAKKEEELVNVGIILEQYRVRAEEIEEKYSFLENELQQKSMEITTLHANLSEAEHVKKLEGEKATMLEHSILEHQQQITEMNVELQEKASSVELLNSNLKEYHNLLGLKDAEINNLKLIIEEKEQAIISINENIDAQNNTLINEYTQEINTLKNRLAESEFHYEERLSAKETELETLKVQISELSQKVKENEQLAAILVAKEAAMAELEQKVVEQNILLEDENKQLTELREIIESQVLKIEELNQELYAKSNDYDSLIAEMDIRRSPNTAGTSEQSASLQTSHFHEQPRARNLNEEDLTDPVNRAEHDLALYMLHQRDVRCEELTVELTQLLEERDTLQLRLSNAIREKEELRRKYQADVSMSEDEGTDAQNIGAAKGAVPKTSKATAIMLGATGTEMAMEATEHVHDESESQLANKLSELKSVGYRKDKSLLDEQQVRRMQQLAPLLSGQQFTDEWCRLREVSLLSELKSVGYRKDKSLLDEQQVRRMQQLSIMQQHRDVAAKLPPEAAARLVDASYTLSRDVQSPSKVLLNWLWGRSTPKVNNI